MSDADIFDRAARRQRRDRAAPAYPGFDFLRAAMLAGIEDRLGAVRRRFAAMLDLGSFGGDLPVVDGARVARIDPGRVFARQSAGIQADEDRLPFADESFDLVVSAGTLDTVGDLPGALTLVRRVLLPDGLFLGAFVGGTSLPVLRGALREADLDRAVQRIHPAVDVRSGGDLLVRAGFALPVADMETVSVRYPDLWRLLADLRGMAATNLLRERHPLTRAALGRAAAAFAARADADGRVAERFDIVYLTGWAPAPSQPQPARRGSGTSSLARALERRGKP